MGHRERTSSRPQAREAEHTSTFQTVKNLGNLYVADQGKLAQAEKMYMRPLRGSEKARGAEHPVHPQYRQQPRRPLQDY
ncbi:hypothetical protein LTS01_024539 [Friedmanniomyces endolithicus]|nr:hypothetical protein LTS01_024539 [Friedmanniomyces endolithicus]